MCHLVCLIGVDGIEGIIARMARSPASTARRRVSFGERRRRNGPGDEECLDRDLCSDLRARTRSNATGSATMGMNDCILERIDLHLCRGEQHKMRRAPRDHQQAPRDDRRHSAVLQVPYGRKKDEMGGDPPRRQGPTRQRGLYGGTIPSIAGSAWKRTLAGMGQDAFSAEDLRAMKQEEQLAAKEEKSKKKRLGRLSKDKGLSRSSTRELSTNGKNGNGHI